MQRRKVILISFFTLRQYVNLSCLQNYRGRLNHKNTPDFVREFEQEHHGNITTATYSAVVFTRIMKV